VGVLPFATVQSEATRLLCLDRAFSINSQWRRRASGNGGQYGTELAWPEGPQLEAEGPNRSGVIGEGASPLPTS